MKRTVLLIAVLALLSVGASASRKDIVRKEKGSITFRVDLDLPEPDGELRERQDYEILQGFLNKYRIPGSSSRVVASSFSDAQHLCSFNDTKPFFSGMIEAFAGHRPVVLTPDVIWLLISQGFAHYVNGHSEEMRDLLVDHEGDRMTLLVKSDKDLLGGDADWSEIVADFAGQLDRYTKSDVADMMTADFTTTGPDELLVSRVTLMESLKAYFEYVVMYASCGIPEITLKGTPEDWQKVLKKVCSLEQYGLGWWVDELKPILEQFVKASKGKVDREFWMSIVKKYRPGDIRGGGCSMELPTKFDGWFLKFMPFDRSGRTPESVDRNHEMLSEMVTVPFRYIITDEMGNPVSECEMELWAGLYGWEQNVETYALTPKIGWFVRVSKTEQDLVNEMKYLIDQDGLVLKVSEVPEVLKKLEWIPSLDLQFFGKVEIPEWLYSKVGSLRVTGTMTKEEQLQLERRFPNASFNRK